MSRDELRAHGYTRPQADANGWHMTCDCGYVTRGGSEFAVMSAVAAHLLAALDALLAALDDAHEALRGVSNACGCFAGCTGALPGTPANRVGQRAHTPACRAARAALVSRSAPTETARDPHQPMNPWPQYDYASDPRYCGEQTHCDGETVTCWWSAGHEGPHQGQLGDDAQFTWPSAAGSGQADNQP